MRIHYTNINLIELGAQCLLNRFVDVLSGPERALFAALRDTGWVTVDRNQQIFLVPSSERLDFIRNITWHENEKDGQPVFHAFYRNFSFELDPVAHTLTIFDPEGPINDGTRSETYHVMPDCELECDDGDLDLTNDWPDEEWSAWQQSVAALYSAQGITPPEIPNPEALAPTAPTS